MNINTKVAPTDDIRVRQAVFHAIDRESTVKNILGDLGIPARSQVSPKLWGFWDVSELWPKYDPKLAVQKLNDAGFFYVGHIG